MNAIVLNLDQAFEEGEIDIAHAIETIGGFIKNITETGELSADKVEIEKFAFKNDHVDDTVAQLGLELAICDAIKRICNQINIAVERRETSNEKMIAGLNEIINRK